MTMLTNQCRKAFAADNRYKDEWGNLIREEAELKEGITQSELYPLNHLGWQPAASVLHRNDAEMAGTAAPGEKDGTTGVMGRSRN